MNYLLMTMVYCMMVLPCCTCEANRFHKIATAGLTFFVMLITGIQIIRLLS